jgi:hypothetical protein
MYAASKSITDPSRTSELSASVRLQAEAPLRAATIAGVILTTIGVIALLFGGFSYTKREKILDVGPIEATTERRETIAVPPILGGLAVAGGLALLFVGARRKEN